MHSDSVRLWLTSSSEYATSKKQTAKGSKDPRIKGKEGTALLWASRRSSSHSNPMEGWGPPKVGRKWPGTALLSSWVLIPPILSQRSQLDEAQNEEIVVRTFTCWLPVISPGMALSHRLVLVFEVASLLSSKPQRGYPQKTGKASPSSYREFPSFSRTKLFKNQPTLCIERDSASAVPMQSNASMCSGRNRNMSNFAAELGIGTLPC